MSLGRSIIIVIVSCNGIFSQNDDDTFKYENWKFHFIPGSGMGMFLALAIPLDLPNKNTYLAYNFEANYVLPGNETYFEYPPLIERRIDRQLIYNALETKMLSSGYSGKACMLRTICETASNSLRHLNGVLGDIIHIIFTPSSSSDKVSKDYELAETQGRNTNDCKIYNKECTVSFLDLISWIGKST